MSGLRLAATQRELRRGSVVLLLKMLRNPDRVTAAEDVTVASVPYPAVDYRVGDQTFTVMFDDATGLPARIRTRDRPTVVSCPPGVRETGGGDATPRASHGPSQSFSSAAGSFFEMRRRDLMQHFPQVFGFVVSSRFPADHDHGSVFKDTVIAYPSEITRIRAKLSLPGRYIWHCHIAEHEDTEMMRSYRVRP
jgi:hypothetical protein